jgi:four helix bundle protein
MKVWQQAMRLAHLSYDCTNLFPPIERFVLLPQVRRAALSVPANIAEGQGRAHAGEFQNFVSIARGSLQELETYFLFANQRQYLSDAQLEEPMEVADHVSRMLTRLRQTVSAQPRRLASRRSR